MKGTFAFFAPALIACAALSPIMAKADVAEGRALYHGHAGFARGVEATNLHLPSEFTACAKCHGAFGEGGREGGVTAPALTWSALTTPRGEAPAFQAESQILDAVTKGVARGGAALGPTMPRYTLSDVEMSALLAYLKHVGRADDYPPGVDRQTIRLATMLPLSGAASAAGHAVLDGMRGAFDAVNSNGGLYGRKLVLEAIDIEQDAQALAKDISLRRPFAVVGGMWRLDAPISLELAKQRIAKIATLTPHKDASSLDAWDIDLLPPLDQQRNAIESALKNCAAPGPKWAIVSNIAIASTPMAEPTLVRKRCRSCRRGEANLVSRLCGLWIIRLCSGQCSHARDLGEASHSPISRRNLSCRPRGVVESLVCARSRSSASRRRTFCARRFAAE